MDWKLFGMALIFGASLWTGCQAALGVQRSYRELCALRYTLELMRCEIACNLTPLRKLTDTLCASCRGNLSTFYRLLGDQLLHGADPETAARYAFRGVQLHLPQEITQSLSDLFSSFGSYDYSGQLRLIELTQTKVAAALTQLESEKQQRSRSYALLGLCTGLALIILVA